MLDKPLFYKYFEGPYHLIYRIANQNALRGGTITGKQSGGKGFRCHEEAGQRMESSDKKPMK